MSPLSCLFLFIHSSSVRPFTSFPPVLSCSSLLFLLLSSFYFLFGFLGLFGSVFIKILKGLASPSCFLRHLQRSADNSTPRRLHHVRLAGERPGTQDLHAALVPTVAPAVLHPSMPPAQQLNVRLHVGHRVAPHTAGLLQIGLALLLHQRGQRRRLGGGVVLSDGDLGLGQVA